MPPMSENLPEPLLPAKTKKSRSPLVWILGLSAVFFFLFLIGSGIALLGSSGKSAKHKRGAAGALFSDGSVGILEVSGVIMDSKKTLKRLESFEEDDDVKAVVVRLNSPGGSVGPSQEIYEAVRKFKKPIVSSMGSIAASGAFYIAMGTKKIFANAGTLTGSIGVIMEFANIEKLYEWAKIKRFAIKTGKFKDTGSEYREMTAEDRALLQDLVDDVLLQFKQAVADGRKLPMAAVTPIADGRVLSGSQAKKAKLIDEIGTLQDAVDEAAKLAGLTGKPNVVYPEKSRSKLFEMLLDDRTDDNAESGVAPATLFERLAQAFTHGSSASLNKTISGLDPGLYWIWQGAR
jgi:protease-4